MTCNDLKLTGITAALDFVEIAVALWFGESERTGGDEISHGDAMGVESDIAAFGLGYGKQVPANAGEIDDLRGRGAGIACGHSLGGVVKDGETNGQSYENTDELSHEASLDPGKGGGKAVETRECQRVLEGAKEAERPAAATLHYSPSSWEETRGSI